MIITNKEDNNLMVIRNSGGGKFLSSYGLLETGKDPQRATACDVNKDGWMDIMVSCHDSREVYVYLNLGTGYSFSAAKYETGIDPARVTAVDLNLDGYKDMVLGNKNCVSVFINNKDGTFQEQVQYPVESFHPVKLLAEDLNDDGYPDLVLTGMGPIFVFRNNGDGAFVQDAEYPTLPNPTDLNLKDLNNDGDLDLIVTYYGRKKFAIYENLGGGRFSVEVEYRTGREPGKSLIADLNKDGFVDIIYGNDDDDDISLLLNYGDGTFRSQFRFGKGKNTRDPLAADINKDGDLDIIVANKGESPYEENGFISLFYNLGDGIFDDTRVNLWHEPHVKSNFTPGDNIQLVMDLKSCPKPSDVNIYFLMIDPTGAIYSGMDWSPRVKPSIPAVNLPPFMYLQNIIMLELSIPSQNPPVMADGDYIFALLIVDSDTGEIKSNIATTSFNVMLMD